MSLTETPRPAASLVLLRDRAGDADGVEIYMLQRHGDDNVLAGAHVFPGGKVDREDADADLLARLGQPAESLRQQLGEMALSAETAASIVVAALRETFEETGVLLGVGADAAVAAQASVLRREGLGFGEVLEALSLQLDARALGAWSRWITPRAPTLIRKRFDVRFFVGRLPAGQSPEPDVREAVAGEWLVPRDALERYWHGGMVMAAPQIMTLAHLARFPNVGAVLDEARKRVPPLIEPEPFEVEGGRLICYPGDERHSVRERAMPGPTRMLFADERFRPVEGFDAWFD